MLIGHPAKSGTVHYRWCRTPDEGGPRGVSGNLLDQQAAVAVLTEEHITMLLATTNAEILARGKAASCEVEAVEAKLDDARKRLDRAYSSRETGALEVDVPPPASSSGRRQ